MASSENILTRAQDWLSGNPNSQQLRKLRREQELLDAQTAAEKAARTLEDAKRRVQQLTPVEEQRALDRVRRESELQQIPIAAKQDDQRLTTREKTDRLDVARREAMEGIETDSAIRQTNNQYENIASLIAKQSQNETNARDAFIDDNAALRDWIAEQAAVNRAAINDQIKEMEPGFFARLGETARDLAPLLLAFTS